MILVALNEDCSLNRLKKIILLLICKKQEVIFYLDITLCISPPSLKCDKFG